MGGSGVIDHRPLAIAAGHSTV